jgi:hypothetical protein
MDLTFDALYKAKEDGRSGEKPATNPFVAGFAQANGWISLYRAMESSY